MFLDLSEFRKFDTYPAWKKKKYHTSGFQKQTKKPKTPELPEK